MPVQSVQNPGAAQDRGGGRVAFACWAGCWAFAPANAREAELVEGIQNLVKKYAREAQEGAGQRR